MTYEITLIVSGYVDINGKYEIREIEQKFVAHSRAEMVELIDRMVTAASGDLSLRVRKRGMEA